MKYRGIMIRKRSSCSNKVGIVGHFGGENRFTDGQTVKVLSLFEGLSLHRPNLIIERVDTYYIRKKPLIFAISFIKCIFNNRKIVFLPASRGRKIMFRLFYYLSKYFGKEVYHDCIAGSLNEELIIHPEWIKFINRYVVNWMESPEQVEKLHQIGVRNAVYMPNFKHIEPISPDEMHTISYSKPFCFCTFSRVEPKKGIEDALKVIKQICDAEGPVAHLDIYGPVQSGYEQWFEQLVVTFHDICSYKGVVDPHLSVSTLKLYFALLFPTQYYTEGMPGTIIDAMFAGVPVVARRWAWCDNMIQSGYNGISYDFEKPEKLKDIVLRTISNPIEIILMKDNCLKESEKYSEKAIVEKICETMGI